MLFLKFLSFNNQSPSEGSLCSRTPSEVLSNECIPLGEVSLLSVISPGESSFAG